MTGKESSKQVGTLSRPIPRTSNLFPPYLSSACIKKKNKNIGLEVYLRFNYMAKIVFYWSCFCPLKNVYVNSNTMCRLLALIVSGLIKQDMIKI